jgi:hypothetical protein
MAVKIFLGVNALLFIGYGLACLASPVLVADLAGMALTTGVATAEVRAMYGGLQTAIGLLALLGILRPAIQPAVLLALGFLFIGLASGRAIGILVEPDAGAYNTSALVFEAAFGALAVLLLSRTASARAAPSVA